MAAKGSVLIGAADENYVLYQLHRRDLLAAPAPTGAPIADLIVFDPKMSVGSMVQVKTTTKPGSWVVTAKNTRPEYVHPRLFHALVALVSATPEVFVVPSAVIADVLTTSHRIFLDSPGRRGQQRNDTDVRSIMRRYPFEVPGYPDGWLEQYRDRWEYLQAEPEALATLVPA